MLDDGEVQQRLGYHPVSDATRPAYEMNRSGAILLAEMWNRTLPAGREAALALTALQEALMWANAAVACRAGDDWQLEAIDVSEFVDDLLEHLEGPLHLRSGSVGGGGAVSNSNGGDIGPDDPSSGADALETAEIVPAAGISATHLDPGVAQQLLERHGSLGPADDIARRSRGETVTFDDGPYGNVPAGYYIREDLDRGEVLYPIEPVEGAERVLRGDCLALAPHPSPTRCELVAGHPGEHSRDGEVWS